MTYEETMNYIHRVAWTGSRPGLERITELLAALGNPQDGLRFVHVAGTNGKGSFCSMLDSVLRHAGYRVGLYTSPYIERFNERMAVDGEPISNAELSEITERVRVFADKMADPPTEFELITAVAMVYFAAHGCDLVVLEVGMGGRLDATNIIKTPILSVITGISLDHTAFLGDTVEAVAGEKAGIIKHGVPVLFGGNDKKAAAVIRARAAEQGSDYYEVDRSLIRNLRGDFDRNLFDFDTYTDIKLSLIGSYQPYNAANVIRAVEILRTRGLEISESDLRGGLATAKWKGRFELLCRKPIFIIDGSHNPEGIAAAVESVRACFGERKVYLLSGVMKDKDYAAMARELSAVACRAFTLRPNNPRSLDAADYAAAFCSVGLPAEGFPDIRSATFAALDAALTDGVPLVALGSLYMYGDVKAAFLEHEIRSKSGK
ncbi:MAG: bifunctional folylpolyglutamate synthase/dihydrofolate synthase [Clostridia bacterium]|nr:bifunctional folylpolyglutamate synthase/dihydrofolate synthase [Clostridia bacterium]